MGPQWERLCPYLVNLLLSLMAGVHHIRLKTININVIYRRTN